MNLTTIDVSLMDLQHPNTRALLPALRTLVRMLGREYDRANCELLGPCVEEPERNVWHIEMRRAGASFWEHWKATVHRDDCVPVHFLNVSADETYTVDCGPTSALSRLGRFAN